MPEPLAERLGLPPAPAPALPLKEAAFMPANGGAANRGRLQALREPAVNQHLGFPNVAVFDIANYRNPRGELADPRLGDFIRVEAVVGGEQIALASSI